MFQLYTTERKKGMTFCEFVACSFTISFLLRQNLHFVPSRVFSYYGLILKSRRPKSGLRKQPSDRSADPTTKKAKEQPSTPSNPATCAADLIPCLPFWVSKRASEALPQQTRQKTAVFWRSRPWRLNPATCAADLIPCLPFWVSKRASEALPQQTRQKA